MQPVECAVIAAAGLGSRLGHGLPKCMLELGGTTILSRLIDTLQSVVPRIHVVVGYREEMIIDLCAKQHREIVIVRNPDFRNTNTAQSMALGARACFGKTLFLDGDLIISPHSFHNFVKSAASAPIMMGIAPTRSENAVCVRLKSSASQANPIVESFTRETRLPFEWANVFAGPPEILAGAKDYVFDRLANHLPIPAFELELREIDTVGDLEDAKAFAQTLPATSKTSP